MPYRGVDDACLDALTFRPDSALGVPRIMDVYRAGNIANAPGTGTADDRAIYSYMPEIVEFNTGRKSIPGNIPTWRCSKPESGREVASPGHAVAVHPPDPDRQGDGAAPCRSAPLHADLGPHPGFSGRNRMVAPYTMAKPPWSNIGTANIMPVTNPIERLNGEIRRRADVVGDVVGIVPNDDAIVRLVGALLLE